MRPRWVAFLLAVVALVLVAGLRVGLERLGLIQRTPFVMFALPVVVAAWHGGFLPGLCATLLSALTIEYLFLAPYGSLRMARQEIVPLLLFAVQGVFVSWLGGSRRRVQTALEASHRELENRVALRTAALRGTNVALQEQMDTNAAVMERMRTQSDELQRSNRELQDFASVASHDLQEPLRKIQAFGDRLRARCAEQLSDDGRDYLARMQTAAGRMSVLINDLLTFSRVTTKALPFEPTDLNDTLAAVRSDLESRIEQTSGTVEAGPLPTIEADPTQMRQLFQNLVSNGLKFHRDDVPPRVQITASSPEPAADGTELCEIRVRDNGIGFDEKYLDRIFEIFQRLHGRNAYEGTGIGLAVCRKIVERHGGRITAESQPGQGATFIVHLPCRQAGTTEPLATESHHDRAAPADYDPAGR